MYCYFSNLELCYIYVEITLHHGEGGHWPCTFFYPTIIAAISDDSELNTNVTNPTKRNVPFSFDCIITSPLFFLYQHQHF